MSLLNKNGIPCDTPHLIFGNLFQMRGLSMVERQRELIKKYGKIVGYYTGAKINVLVADPELTKKILISDFNNFTNRSPFLKYSATDPKFEGSIFVVRDQRWKHFRSYLTPSFSSSKLKAMIPLLDTSVDSFLKIISKKSENEEEFNIHELYKRLCVEMIMKTGFGVDIDEQNNYNKSKLFENIELYISTKMNKLSLLLLMCFPVLANIIYFMKGITQDINHLMGVSPTRFLLSYIKQIIESRKMNYESRHDDVLGAILDSKMEPRKENKIKTELNRNQIQLTEDEIKCNCIHLITPSYTTGVVFAYVTHILINHPEIQEKVRREVIEFYESEGKIDYNTTTKLEYMEWVINETMRIYPSGFNSSTRECAKDYTYKNLTIPKGAQIVICTNLLQNDPDYWSEPEKFDPMRFSPERRHEIKSVIWLPFGEGPRNCIGMRYAFLTMKLTFAKLLLEYRLEVVPKSEIGDLYIEYNTIISTGVPMNGIFVRAVKI